MGPDWTGLDWIDVSGWLGGGKLKKAALLVGALILACLGASARPAEAPAFIDFPRNESFGALFILSGSGVQTRRFYCQAQGRVLIPPSRCLGLAAGYALVNDMTLLEKLPGDVIKDFTIDRVETADDKPIKFKSVGHLTGLDTLSIKDCNIDDQAVACLKNLTHLRRLKLWYCGLHGDTLHELLGLKDLEELDLSLNRLSPSAYPVIAKMSQLKKLDLTDGSVNEAALVEISKLSNLERLNLSGNPAIGKTGVQPLRKCKKLFDLSLSRCKLTADQLLALKGLPLAALNLSGRGFTREDMQKLQQAFPKATIVEADRLNAHDKYMFSPLH